MRTIILSVVTIMCVGLMACVGNETASDAEYAGEVWDSSASVETVIGNGGKIADVGITDGESEVSDNSMEVSEKETTEYEELPLDWKGDEAELKQDCLYYISEEDTLVIDFKYAGTEWDNDSLVPNPPQDQIITVKASANEIQLVGNYITLNKAYLVQADTGLYLLMETDEDSDMDEKLWLFVLEDGKVTQCGDSINAKLDDALVWNYNDIQCLEIVDIAERMTEAEHAAGKTDDMYQRRDYKIEDGKLTAIHLLKETEEIKTNLHTYKATLFRNEETQEVVRWEVEVYNGDALMQTIYYDHDEYVSCIPDMKKLIWEEDVNFDGTKDILVWQGHYGTHGDLGYRCYLANEENVLYDWCESFQEISNPKVDGENKLIQGSYRGGGVYTDTFYRYDGESFVLERREMYVWDDANEEFLLLCSLDASVVIYTQTDYALVGTYESTSGLRYGFSVYTSGDGMGECVDIGNIASYVTEDPYEQATNTGWLYKINDGQYFVLDYDTLTGYYLFAKQQNDVWTIEIRDRTGKVLDTLTQTEHYES